MVKKTTPQSDSPEDAATAAIVGEPPVADAVPNVPPAYPQPTPYRQYDRRNSDFHQGAASVPTEEVTGILYRLYAFVNDRMRRTMADNFYPFDIDILSLLNNLRVNLLFT